MELVAQSVATCLYCEEDFICSALFEKRRLPISLPCHHNICLLCLFDVILQQVHLQCKICSLDYSSSDLIKKKLPLSYYALGKSHSSEYDAIIKRLEVIGKKNTCYLCHASCLSKCLDCDKAFCLVCSEKVHNLTGALSNHKTESIDLKTLACHCTAHGYFGEHYCKNDSEYLCNLCIINDPHKDHEIHSLNDVVSNSDGMDTTGCQPWSCSYKHFQKENTRKVWNKVQVHMSDLFSKLQRMEENLLNQLVELDAKVEDAAVESLACPGVYQSSGSNIRFSFDVKIFNQLQKHCSLSLSPRCSKGHGKVEQDNTTLACRKGSKAFCEEIYTHRKYDGLRKQPWGGSRPERGNITSDLPWSTKGANTDVSVGPGNQEIENSNGVDGKAPLAEKVVSKPKFYVGQRLGKIEDSNIASADKHGVLITHLVSPSEFYVQKQTDVEKIRFVTKETARIIRNTMACPPCASIVPGELYLVHYTEDNKWYRGRCLRITEAESGQVSASIYFVDFGNNDNCLSNGIRPIPPHLAAYPPLATPCRLHAIRPKHGQYWSRQAVHSFSFNTCESLLEMVVVRDVDGVLEVDLFRNAPMDRSPLPIRDLMVLQGHAVHIGDDDCPVAASDFSPCVLLPPGGVSEGFVSHVVSPALLYIQKTGVYSKALNDLMAVLQCHFSDLPDTLLAFQPVPGVPCASLYSEDMQWYRARVLKVSRAQVKVHYVDFGNTELVDSRYLRPLPEALKALPIAAMPCSLYGIQPVNTVGGWTAVAASKLNDWICNKKIKFRVELNNEEISVITVFESGGDVINSLNNKLVENCLAVSAPPTTSVPTLTKVDENCGMAISSPGTEGESTVNTGEGKPDDVSLKLPVTTAELNSDKSIEGSQHYLKTTCTLDIDTVSTVQRAALTPEVSSVQMTGLTPEVSSVQTTGLTPEVSSVPTTGLTPEVSSVQTTGLTPEVSTLNMSSPTS